jgi:protoheme ferro-lyase
VCVCGGGEGRLFSLSTMCDDGHRSSVLSDHFNTPTRYGVPLVCEGAPESTSLMSVLSFLARKLRNPRFYSLLPTWLWHSFVYAVMLPCIVRDQQRMYRRTWVASSLHHGRTCSEYGGNPDRRRTAGGSVVTAAVVASAEQLAHLLEKWMHHKLMDRDDVSVQVEVGFYHRSGSVEAALERLQLRGNYGKDARDSSGAPIVVESESLIVLPLYPQHKAELTGTVWDAVMRSPYFQRHHSIPNVHFIRNYAYNEVYLDTWHRHIRSYMGRHGTPDWLFVVFHRMQKSMTASEDTYREEYTYTVEQLRERLSTRWITPSLTPASDDGDFFRGWFPSSRITTAFFGPGNEALREPQLERVFLSIIRQLKCISAANSVNTTPLTSALVRDGSSFTHCRSNSSACSGSGYGAAADQSRSCTLQRVRTPLPLEMAPTAYVVCPGEALDDTTTLIKLQKSLFPVVKRLGWRDVQYIPALNATPAHAEVPAAVLETYVVRQLAGGSYACISACISAKDHDVHKCVQ